MWFISFRRRSEYAADNCLRGQGRGDQVPHTKTAGNGIGSLRWRRRSFGVIGTSVGSGVIADGDARRL